MTAPGPLGQTPTTEPLPLTRGADWSWTWTNQDRTGAAVVFPAGTSWWVQLHNLDGTSTRWAANVSGNVASFYEPSSITDAVPDGTGFVMCCQLGTGAPVQPLFIGQIVRFDP